MFVERKLAIVAKMLVAKELLLHYDKHKVRHNFSTIEKHIVKKINPAGHVCIMYTSCYKHKVS